MVRSSDLVNYLRQTPNHKVLGFLKLQLATYSLSGKDSTHWYNRWLRRLGQPPVIYNSDLTEASRRQLRLALVNRGFMQASVEVDTMPDSARRRMDVSYLVNTGPRHRISRMDYDIADTAIARIVRADSALLTLRSGEPFDRDRLDEERSLVTRRLRNHGYYAFAKDYILHSRHGRKLSRRRPDNGHQTAHDARHKHRRQRAVGRRGSRDTTSDLPGEVGMVHHRLRS